MKTDIGIPEKDRKNVAEALKGILASSYILTLKTHNYHWNVEGINFKPLHDLFGSQYDELFEAVDEIAERIRALGFKSPGSFAEFVKLSDISEEKGSPDAETMVKNLVKDHETIAKQAREIIKIGNAAGDDASVDLMVERLHAHDKTAWMLRSTAA